MEKSAMTLVYLSESRRRRKDSGMTMSLVGQYLSLSTLASNLHESRDPELSVYQESDIASAGRKSSNNARHEISDNDKVADGHAEALDGDSGVEDDGQIRVCHLRQRRKGDMSAVEVSCASRLEVETEAGCCTRPCDNEDAEEDAHFRERRGHGEQTGTKNCT
jgi:hypothetical protein